MKSYDCIIVGGGIAGLSAAIYLRRKNICALVMTLDIGGRTNLPKFIENYPGYKKIEGYRISLNCKEQAEDLGAEFAYEKVREIKKGKDGFTVNSRSSRALLLAFGKSPRILNAKNEDKFIGKGIDYNIRNYDSYKNKRVAVIGAGNSAFTSAWELRDIAAVVVIINIGCENDVTLVKYLVKVNEINEVIINDRNETSEVGVYCAGDCSSIPFKQSIISAGEGVKAALAIYQYLTGSKIKV